MIVYQERVQADLSDITVTQYTGQAQSDRVSSLHRHKFCEIIFVSQGYCEISYCGEHIVLLAGSLVLIAPEEVHAVSLRTGCEIYTCHFPHNTASEKLNQLLEDRAAAQPSATCHPERVLSWSDSDPPPAALRQSKYSHRFQLLGADKDHILSILQALQTEQTTQDVGYLGMKQCYLEQLLIMLNRILEGQFKRTMDYHSWKQDMVNSVLAQIEADVTVPFDCNAFAQSHGITPTYFRSIFKSIVNMSPIDYLNHVRVAKALELLQVTSLSISEIASRVGIYDANYFSRLFKKVTGYPPRYFKSIPDQGYVMRNFEIGILPESTCFSFSPNTAAKEIFLYPTMCGHYFCTSEYYIKRKSFPRLLLVYVCSGTLHLELGDNRYAVNDGQVLLFDCKQPHHYYATDALEFYFLHFDGAQAHELCRYINQTSGLIIDGPNNEKVHDELRDLIQFYEDNNSESVMASSGRIYRILTLLDNPVMSPQLQKHGDAINQAVRYIRSNVGKKITLHELAELCGLSDYYFSHIFKDITGLSPSNFITYSRIDQAKSLLSSTSLTLPQIAKQVGYANSSNLIVQFTDRVGCTPQEFRAQHQGDGLE